MCSCDLTQKTVEKKGAQTLWKYDLEGFSRRKAYMCVYSQKMNSLEKVFWTWLVPCCWIKARPRDAPKSSCGWTAPLPLLPYLPSHDSQAARGGDNWDDGTYPPSRGPACTGPEMHLPPVPGESSTARAGSAPALERPACSRDMMERAQSLKFKCQVQVHLLALTSWDLLGKSLKFSESWAFFWSIKCEEGPLSPRLLYGFSGGSVHTSALQTVLLLLSIITMAFPPIRRIFFLCRGFPFRLQIYLMPLQSSSKRKPYSRYKLRETICNVLPTGSCRRSEWTQMSWAQLNTEQIFQSLE